MPSLSDLNIKTHVREVAAQLPDSWKEKKQLLSIANDLYDIDPHSAAFDIREILRGLWKKLGRQARKSDVIKTAGAARSAMWILEDRLTAAGF